MLLAGAGFSVTLVEKKDRPGGRMGRIEEEGYAFDTGAVVGGMRVLSTPHVTKIQR